MSTDIDRIDMIMMILSMFESTALILTVITIGKFLEGNLFSIWTLNREGEKNNSYYAGKNIPNWLVT